MSTPENSEDDAEQMRLAFEAFMLKGKGATSSTKISGDASTNTTTTSSSKSKKAKKKKRPSSGPSPQKPQTTPTNDTAASPSPRKLDQSIKKRYYQLLRSFSNKIHQSWFEIDNQLLAVLESIVSIRGRLPLEWKSLHSYDDGKHNKEVNTKTNVQNWKGAGFRGMKEIQQPVHLHRADIQLALDNDLEQHEKMITALRSLISELSECHDSLGRVVDTIWMFHLEHHVQDDEEFLHHIDEINEESEMSLLVQNATVFFQTLSQELYRKQGLISTVIDTTNDEILGIGSDLTIETPLKVARICHRQWERQVDQQLLTWTMQLGSQ